MTGLAGFAWFIYIMIYSKGVTFSNNTIQYQIPILIIVVMIKYIILVKSGFKSHKKVFYANILLYTIFLGIVLLLDV